MNVLAKLNSYLNGKTSDERIQSDGFTRGSNFIELEFDGYWRDINISVLPNIQGIYCVYTCRYVPESKAIALNKLIYIGTSNCILDDINGRKQNGAWYNQLNDGEELCYSFSTLPQSQNAFWFKNYELIQIALVNVHKPVCNSIKSNDFFVNNTIELRLIGDVRKLETEIRYPSRIKH